MFENCTIISCGMLHPEIQHLVSEGFLNPTKIFFTPPGLHALPERLEEHLRKRLNKAQKLAPDQKRIIIYGKKCYINPDEPLKRVESILETIDQEIVRVEGEYGYDMLAGLEERQRISNGRQDKILWFTPGWLKSWQNVYQGYFHWDRADANANFPGYYDKVIVLDTLHLEEEYMTRHPEEILELFEWTGLEVEFHPITLDHFKGLLEDALFTDPMRTGP